MTHTIKIIPDPELDKPIGQREIIKAYTNIKNGKSCGVDDILNDMVWNGQSVLIPCFEKLFRFILSSGYYHRIW